MNIERVNSNVEEGCEAVLRSLPKWFGQEDCLVEYARDTSNFPTWVATAAGEVLGFITIKNHAKESYEIHCMAVADEYRGRGIGNLLMDTACLWIKTQGGTFIQVKTIAPSVESPEYEETRHFYSNMGFVCLEVHPTLWSKVHPCLQMIRNV